MNVARAAHAAGVKPLTGYEEGYDINEKDHQAGTAGGETGPEVAMLAAKDLGLTKEGQEEANEEVEHPSPLMPTRKVARTASGTKHETHIRTASGGRTAEGLGMVPLIRQISSPPAVSPFGGVAPSGTDAERGLRAARSREQEEERQLEIELKGPDPWSVSFEPGESINPKVCHSLFFCVFDPANNNARTGVLDIDGSSPVLLVFSFSTLHLLLRRHLVLSKI